MREIDFTKMLENDEKLVWTGRQKKSDIKPFYRILPFVFPLAFVAVLAVLAYFLTLWVALLALICCYLEAIFIEQYQKMNFKEDYAISNKRIFIKSENQVKMMYIEEIGDITLTKDDGLIGTLVFEQRLLKDSVFMIKSPENIQIKNDFTFIRIYDYVNIYALVNKIRDEIKNVNEQVI